MYIYWCPKCNEKIEIEDDMLGAWFTCPKCHCIYRCTIELVKDPEDCRTGVDNFIE